MGICDMVKRVCPPVETCYNLLREKHEFTLKVFSDPRHGRAVKPVYTTRVVDALLHLFTRTYGKAQNVHLSEPPPPRPVIERAIIYTYPGIQACIYAHYYCDEGILHNEFISLTGPGGLGKSTFAYYLSSLLGGVLLTREDDVLIALTNMLGRDEWRPVIVLDDIAAIISKYWFMNRRERVWANLFKALEYAKDVAGIILTTARSFEGQAKRIRELTTVEGVVKRIVAGPYLMDVIEWRRSTTSRNSAPDYIDVLWPGLKLPDDLWQRQQRKRKIRSRILMLTTLVELAKSGEVKIPEEQLVEIQEKISELYRKLHED